MRIAQVVSSYQPRIGGVEAHVRRLAEGCVEAGDRVTVLTHQVDGASADEWIGAIRVIRFPLTISAHNYPFSAALFQYLRSHSADFDLVHAHSYHTLVGHAAVNSRLPFVFTPHYHGTGHTRLRALLHRLYKSMGARQFRAAEAIVCVSEPERDLVINAFPGAASKAVIIPNGTDVKRYGPTEKKVITDKPIVLTAGRLERYKNVDLIVQAFWGLPSEARLIVVGDGPDRARLERLTQNQKRRWPVLFTGRIADPMLDALLVQSLVVTSASDHEAFGLTIAEGLAAGARVVASHIPAHEEIARLAGVNPPIALVDPRDTRRFTDLLAASLREGRVENQDLKLPSWTDVVGDTRELYISVLAKANPAYRRESS